MANGFERKTYVEIIANMESKAKELFGDSISLEDSSPLGMYIQSIAWELSLAWEEMERSHFSHYAQWATGQDLDNIVANFGRKRFRGTPAMGNVTFFGDAGVVIPEGFRVSTESDLVFETVADIELTGGEDTTRIQSVAIGTGYNLPMGLITEIVNPITGLDSIENKEPTNGGTGIETDDNLRERHLGALREPVTGDNVAQYQQWAKEVEGVGNLRVLETTPSAGFVTLVLADINGQAPTTELITSVEEHIEEVRPVNAGIVVEAATAKEITISADIRPATGYESESVQENFEKLVGSYFRSIAMKDSYVSYAQIGRLLLESQGMFDYKDLLLNGVAGNIELTEKETPILSDVQFGVV